MKQPPQTNEPDKPKPEEKDASNIIAMSNYKQDQSGYQALTFILGGEIFAMDVTRVEEITDTVRSTKVPGADLFAPYVINVRGNVVPLIDLRHRFNLPSRDDTIETRTVVFNVELDNTLTKVALKADSVSDVIDISQSEIEDMPETGTRWNRAFVRGITRNKGIVVIILDIEAIFNFSLTAQNLPLNSTQETSKSNLLS